MRTMKKQILLITMATLTACQAPKQDDFHFDEMTYSPRETVFRLFAPADAHCVVVLEGDSIAMTLEADSIWTATAQGDHKGHTYQFVVDGKASPGVFAKAVTVNGEKAVVLDMADRKLSPNRVAADDNPMKLMSIAMKPIANPPFPIERMEEMAKMINENSPE